MKNKDRDHSHRRRRKAGQSDSCEEDSPDGRAVARKLYGGPTHSNTDETEDMAHPSKRKTNQHEIVVKRQNLSGFRIPCAICGEQMETRAGPWIYLDVPSKQLSYPWTSDVCKECGLRVDPETVREMEEERASWRST